MFPSHPDGRPHLHLVCFPNRLCGVQCDVWSGELQLLEQLRLTVDHESVIASLFCRLFLSQVSFIIICCVVSFVGLLVFEVFRSVRLIRLNSLSRKMEAATYGVPSASLRELGAGGRRWESVFFHVPALHSVHSAFQLSCVFLHYVYIYGVSCGALCLRCQCYACGALLRCLAL